MYKPVHLLFCTTVLYAVLSTTTFAAPVTERASIANDGSQIATGTSGRTAISSDGRFVAFVSGDANIVAGDTNGVFDVFVRDRQNNTTERVSVATGGGESDGVSNIPCISPDGRFVAFISLASNLVAGDTNGVYDIFLRDCQLGTTTRISIPDGGGESDGHSFNPRFSSDGRYVAFVSDATNLVAGDTNGVRDVFRIDTQTNDVIRCSTANDGSEPNAKSEYADISDDGNLVVFMSAATNLIAVDTNAVNDIFLRNISEGTTIRISERADGTEANATNDIPVISGDGTVVAFRSNATNLTGGPVRGASDILAKDLTTGSITLVSRHTDGTVSDGNSTEISISQDGRFVIYSSFGTNLVDNDTNNRVDLFRHDRATGETTRVSVATDGSQGDEETRYSSMSNDGVYIAFATQSTNLVAGDTNASMDIFVRSDPPVVAVPTLSEWGMIVMASLMALSALLLRRRGRVVC